MMTDDRGRSQPQPGGSAAKPICPAWRLPAWLLLPEIPAQATATSPRNHGPPSVLPSRLHPSTTFQPFVILPLHSPKVTMPLYSMRGSDRLAFI